MNVRVLRRADYLRMPWKNGAGLTYEVLTWPPGSGWADFAWRLSFAEVATSGPFSTFPGVDRVIILAEGESMTLNVDGTRNELARYRPFAFRGDSEAVVEVTGPTLDFNVMTRRGRVRADVEVIGTGRTGWLTADGDTLGLVALAGSVVVSADREATHLESMDTMLLTGNATLPLRGDGTLAVARIRGT